MTGVPPPPGPVPVELVRWPAEADRRQALAAGGVPRLLLVERGSTSPPRLDDDEDWIRLPADERDVWARLDRLAVHHARRLRRPRLSDEGVLDYAGRRAVVGVQCAPLLALLVTIHTIPGRGALLAPDEAAAVPAGDER